MRFFRMFNADEAAQALAAGARLSALVERSQAELARSGCKPQAERRRFLTLQEAAERRRG